MEQNDIVALRNSFLRKICTLRANGDPRPVVYLDETWVNEKHSRSQIWQNDMESESFKMLTSKSYKSLILCHAGSEKFGFVPKSKLVFCYENNDDNNFQMNDNIFKNWFYKMLKHLEEPCIIVMDNAPYHNMVVENIPKSNTSKVDIQTWLNDKGIDFMPIETLAELREKVKLVTSMEKRYEIDELAFEMGHEVIRLPPFHCQYNPMELIWAQIKGEVASKNTTFKMEDVEKLIHEAMDAVTIDDWKKHVKHVEVIQETDYEKERLRDDILEPIIKTISPNINNCSSDEDD